MTLIMSGAISFINLGVVDAFRKIWVHARVMAVAITYPLLPSPPMSAGRL